MRCSGLPSIGSLLMLALALVLRVLPLLPVPMLLLIALPPERLGLGLGLLLLGLIRSPWLLVPSLALFQGPLAPIVDA